MMDEARFDTLARALDARSRRRVLSALSSVGLGVLASVWAVAPTEAKKKGGKKNEKHDGKNGKDKACPVCPESLVCPDSAVCPEPPPAPTCAQACGLCILCYTRAADSLLCSFDTRFIADCESATFCDSDNDCVGSDRPYCVTHITPRGSAERFEICGTPGGRCTAILDRCSS